MKKFSLNEKNEPFVDPQGKSSLEVANEIFRNVYSQKMSELRLQFPDLSEAELKKMTAEFIRTKLVRA